MSNPSTPHTPGAAVAGTKAAQAPASPHSVGTSSSESEASTTSSTESLEEAAATASIPAVPISTPPASKPGFVPTKLTANILLPTFDDTRWKINYLELARYKMLYVNPFGPDVLPLNLSEWVQEQHREFTLYVSHLEGKQLETTCTFNTSKLELLRQLGFRFQRWPLPAEVSVEAAVTPVQQQPELQQPQSQQPKPSSVSDDVFNTPASKESKVGNRYEQHFQSRADQLREFRDEYGHCDPANAEELKYKGLASWVLRWRKLVQDRLKGKENDKADPSITDERLDRLRDIGITTLRDKTKKLERAAQHWDKMFELMKKFQEKHGHTIVPEKEYPKERTWLVSQRKEYAKMVNGEPTQMTALQYSRLKSIGFSFEARPKYTFEERFDQWMQFKQQNGGKDPTTKQAIGKWISKTRLKYHAKMAGKPSPLTDEQVRKLEENGFVWARVLTKHESLPWEERYKELCEYRQKHSTTNVPQNLTGLGQWVHKQRTLYQKHLAGEAVMRQDKIEKLNAIGFCWVARARSLKRAAKYTSSDEEDDEDDELEQPTSKRYHMDVTGYHNHAGYHY